MLIAGLLAVLLAGPSASAQESTDDYAVWTVNEYRMWVSELAALPTLAPGTVSGASSGHESVNVALLSYNRQHIALAGQIDHLAVGSWGSGSRIRLTCDYEQALRRGLYTNFGAADRFLMTGIESSCPATPVTTRYNRGFSIVMWGNTVQYQYVGNVPDGKAAQWYSHQRTSSRQWCSSVPWNIFAACWEWSPSVPAATQFMSGLVGNTRNGMFLDHAAQFNIQWRDPQGTWWVSNYTDAVRYGWAGAHVVPGVEGYKNGMHYCYRAQDKGQPKPGPCH